MDNENSYYFYESVHIYLKEAKMHDIRFLHALVALLPKDSSRDFYSERQNDTSFSTDQLFQ